MAIAISPGISGFQPAARIIAELRVLEKVAKNAVVGCKTIVAFNIQQF